MLLPLAELRLIQVDDVALGTLVLPVGDSSHDSTPAIVVDGGEFKAGRMLLPLGGEAAFQPREPRGAQVVALSNRKILMRFTDLSEVAPDKYLSGQISVDEDAAYMILRFQYAMREQVYLLNLSTWIIERASGMKSPAFWPAKWELIARSKDSADDLKVSIYPLPTTDEATTA